MIALWMLSACAFALAVGAVAFAIDRTLRLFRRQSRGVWCAALVLAVLWPTAAPLLRAFEQQTPAVAQLSSTTAVSVAVGALPEIAPTLRDRLTTFDTPLLVVWCAATALLLLRALRTTLALRRVQQHAKAERLSGRAVLSSRHLGPAVFGIFKPQIILPAWAFDLDERDSDLVLRHEECHIRAADPALITISHALIAIAPWNVPIWWIAQQLRVAIEVDCDLRVLHTGADATRYAQLLLLTAQQQRQTMTPSIAGFPSMLKERIHVMHSDQHTHAPSSRARRLVALAMLTAIGAFAATSPLLARELGAMQVPGVLQRSSFMRPQPTQPPMREFKVDTETTIAANSSMPRYPDDLRAAKTNGRTLVQLVIDTMGRADPQTLKMLSTSHPQFGDAVRSAIPYMTFNPARVANRKVKQLVQINFQFEMNSEAGTAILPPSNNIRSINVMISAK